MQINVTQFKRFSIAAFITATTFLVLPNVNAVTPSPAMMEKFKTLPKSQQEKLMKQYGISAEMLGSNGGVGLSETQLLENPTIMNERSSSVNKLPSFNDNNPLHSAETDEIKRYGYDMFEGEPTTFAPVTDVPVPAEYLMGPGDVVKINIYGKVNENFSLTVSRLGNIELPNSGPMSVNGVTFERLQRQLSKKINEQYTGVNSNVSLGELRSIRVIIAGESYKPGSYTVSSLSTITQALFVSGGVSDIASLRNIQLKRAGKNIVTFDLYDLLMKGDATKDARLRSGDVIFIPPVAKTVTVLGEVRRPAIYELKGKETAKDLVKLAAGLNASSFPKASVIERFSSNYLPTLVNVDLTTKNGKQTMIKDGDVLTVQSTTVSVKNQILVAGAVSRPGFYQWRAGMRVSDLIASQWSDLKGRVDLNYALLTREVNLQADIEVIQFSLANIFENNKSLDNLYLEPRDSLIIFNKQDPNEFKYLDSEKEMDLEENAYLDKETDLIEEKLTKEDLVDLYQDKELIKRSSEFTRKTLLLPIINKIKNQDLVNGVTHVASISGEVNFPGEYPISASEKVSDLVIAAGGITESAYVKHAELTKFITGNQRESSMTHHNIALDLALNHDENNDVRVQSRDQLNILRIPSWQENMTVSILGEVKFPGTYPIKEGETIDDVISRAGGFNSQAFLSGAVFTRESVKEQELKQILRFTAQLKLDIVTKGLSSDTVGTSFSESSLMLKELEKVKPAGRMVISLSNNNNNNNNDKGLLVESGDMLFIPSQKQIVSVVGEVQLPSTHFYKNSVSFEDYITLAGGVKSRADEGRIYVIQANGAVIFPQKNFWFSAENNIKPGDTIVVPLDTEFKDNLTLWSQVTGIVYNAAVAIAAVNGI